MSSGPVFEAERDADDESRRRNHALVDEGGGYSDFWVTAQLPGGSWTIEYRRVKVPWRRRVIRALWDSWN